ncbi:response regulator transcription factor [uncultured Thermanaerothrix sp.]|uniref:response regulator n=1 Tax=uncultured Thermanaerothrix sp. TaxID=1195149 RepID=UPI0026386B9E|nr:response regulator transcription factor [uncultured Thermanaerothrix sp.]
MSKIKVLLVDDQALFREGLKTLLNSRPDFEVVGEASNGEEAIRLAHQLRPQVILMDLRMPILDGVQATQRIHTLLPDCRILVLTTFDDDEDVFEGLRAGAIGYLLKDVSSEKLFEAIRAAARGEYFLLPSITAKVVAEFSRLPRAAPRPAEAEKILSPREIEVLRLVAIGISNKEIAERLFISEGTVKNHLSNILSKLNVKDRLQAVIRGRELGLLP